MPRASEVGPGDDQFRASDFLRTRYHGLQIIWMLLLATVHASIASICQIYTNLYMIIRVVSEKLAVNRSVTGHEASH
jgi:hypothetical protein